MKVLRQYLFSFLVNGLLLLLGLLGTAFCFLTGFTLPKMEMTRLFWAYLGTGLLFVGVFSLPKRYRRIPLAVVAVAYAAILFTYRTRFVNGAAIIGSAVITEYARAYTFLPTLYAVARLTVKDTIIACQTFMALASVPYACLLAWTVTVKRSFGLSLALTLPGLASLLIVVTPAWPPLLGLFTFWIVLLVSGRIARVRPHSSDRMRAVLLPAAALLVCTVYVVQPAAGYQRPARLDELRSQMIDEVNGMFAGGGDPFGGNGTLAASSRLDRLGAARFTGQHVLRYRSPYHQRTYLRGYAGERYTGNGWEPLSEEEAAGLAGLGVQPFVLQATEEAAQMEGFAPGSFAGENLVNNSRYVFLPYYLADEAIAGAERVGDNYVRPLAGTRYFQGGNWHTGYLNQELLNLAPLPDEWEKLAAYQDDIQALYTQVPEALNERLQEFLKEAGLANRRDEGSDDLISRVAMYMQNFGSYTTEPGNPPAGEDFVGYFLFESQRGYCVHYASAATLLLRSLGVPARYVVGYVAKAADFRPDHWAEIQDNQAHAWVEVFSSSQGWIPVEVTPGRATVNAELSFTAATPANSAAPVTPTPTPGVTIAPTPTPGPDQNMAPTNPEDDESALAWYLILVLVLAAFMCIVALRGGYLAFHRWLRRARGAPNARALAIYAGMERMARHIPGETVPEPARELALKAKFSQHTLSPGELDRLAYLYKNLRFRAYGGLKWPLRLWYRWGVAAF